MQKRQLILPLAAGALGAAGALLRRREVLTVAEDEKGLLPAGAPASLLTAAVAAGSLAVLALLALALVKKDEKNGLSYGEAFAAPGGLWIFSLLLGAGVLVTGLTGLYSAVAGTKLEMVSALLTALTGAAMLAFGTAQARGRDSAVTRLLGLLPSAAFAFRMALAYKEGAGNPSVSEYAYTCAACGLGAVAFYYLAGFLFHRQNSRAAVLSGLTGACLLLVLFGETGTAGLVYLLTALFLLTQTFCLLSPRPERPEADADDQNG